MSNTLRGMTLIALCVMLVSCGSVGFKTLAYPHDALDSPVRARTMRASSAAEDWRDDNADARHILSGQTLYNMRYMSINNDKTTNKC
ncbi:MAG: hypothetical protein DRR42_19195 [Gammaproteobacteria bacterium]|nr:MAG: hypothetical protein DRR42_19195 [Gammaproteobacteria bacterium]